MFLKSNYTKQIKNFFCFRIKRIIQCFIIFFVASQFFTFPIYTMNLSEDDIKVGFIYNFLKFVKWPHENQIKDKIYLCIKTHSDPISSKLMGISGKRIRDKELKVIELNNYKVLSQCNALFIDKSSKLHEVEAILKQTEDMPILTISDKEGFCEKGGIIQLKKRDNRIRFLINLFNANRVKLYISSKLLMLADKVIR